MRYGDASAEKGDVARASRQGLGGHAPGVGGVRVRVGIWGEGNPLQRLASVPQSCCAASMQRFGSRISKMGLAWCR